MTKVTGEIVIEVTRENEGTHFLRGKTYAVEYAGRRFCGMKAFRTVRKGRRVIVFQPTAKATGPTLHRENSRLIFKPEAGT